MRNINKESDGPAKKRLCVQIRDDCLTHCTEASGDLSSLQDTQSWPRKFGSTQRF